MSIMTFIRRRVLGDFGHIQEQSTPEDEKRRKRELARLDREKQLEVEEGLRRIEWIENEKAIIQREQR